MADCHDSQYGLLSVLSLGRGIDGAAMSGSNAGPRLAPEIWRDESLTTRLGPVEVNLQPTSRLTEGGNSGS